MSRIAHILCLLFLAFAAYAQVSTSNCVYNGTTYTYNNNSVELRCSNYTCGSFNAFDCTYAGSDYSDDCNYIYSQLRSSAGGGDSLYNFTYYTCPQDTFPSPIGFGEPVRNSSDPNLSNCTNLGWTTTSGSNYSCLQYNCSLTNGTTYIRSQCIPANYSCNYLNNITNNYYTCNPFIYNSTCVYSGTTMFDVSEDSDDSYSCNNYNCHYDNQTQFTSSNCTYANTTTGGCTFWNTTYYPNNYQCSLYSCSFSNETQYYKTGNCYYTGSNYTQDCTYINTNAKYIFTNAQPTTGICINYNCLNNNTNITTNKNCTYVTTIDYDNCNYINSTTETEVSSQTTVVFTCDNYQCTANGSSYVFPYCTMTDPVCVSSSTMNTSFICETIQCQFSNGTLISEPDCLGVNCVILNSTNNGTYTCTNYNCSGNSIVTSNCEPNTPTDQQACTFLNITTNSTYNCTNYNCTFSNTFSIVSNCQEIKNNNQSNGTTGNTGNNGNTGNTGNGNTNTGSNGGTGNSGNSGNTGNTGNTGNGQGTGGSQTDNGTGTTSQVSDSSGSSGSSTGIIVGCVLGVAVIAVGGFVWYKFRLAKRAAHNQAGLSTELGTGVSSNVTQLRITL